MFLRRTKKKAQVLLETVIVLVALSTIAMASMHLFSNINFNEIGRLSKYIQSRRQAVNNMVTTSFAPEKFLDYRGPNDIIVPDGQSGGSWGGFSFEDPLIMQAEVLLEEQDNILNIILPYKINQMKYFSDLAHLREVWVYGGGFFDHPEWQWEHPGYLPKIRALASDGVNLGERIYLDFTLAIAKFKEALNQPIIPGPFDDKVAEHPELYNLDPTDQQRIQVLQNRNMHNRQRVESQIASLQQVVLPQIVRLLYGDAYLEGMIPRLQLVRDRINECDNYNCSKYREEARNKIDDPNPDKDDLVGFSGSVNPSILSNTTNLVTKIEWIYNILFGACTYDGVLDAKTITEQILNDPQISGMSEYQPPSGYIPPKGIPGEDGYERGWWPPQGEPGDPDYVPDPGYWPQVSVPGEPNYFPAAGSEPPWWGTFVEMKVAPYLKGVVQRLNNYLKQAIRYWDDPDAEDQLAKENYLELSKVQSWTLYRVTDANRL